MTMSSRSGNSSFRSEKHVDDFDPTRPRSSATGWLRKVASFARENHLSEGQLYSFAVGKLNASAKEWLSHSNVSNWHEFQHALVLAFPEQGNDRLIPATLRTATLERRRRTAKETVPEYIEEMVKLGKCMKLSEQAIVRCIVVGLDDPVLSKAIPARLPVGLRQLLRAIEWQKEVGRLMDQYATAKVSVDSFDRLADEMENFVLDEGDGIGDVPRLQGDEAVLKTIEDELKTLVHQHRTSLSCGLFDLGTCKTHRIVVNLVPSVTNLIEPAGLPTPDYPPDEAKAWQTSLIPLLACDVIQKAGPSSSSALSSVRPVHLRGSELLLDLSHLNAVCCRETANFLLPHALLPALSAFRYFTVLDFDGGHLQIPLTTHGPTRSYLSFACPRRGGATFQFQRAPRNFANTTIIFNKILIELARKLSPSEAVVVLNDVLVVPGRDIPDGLRKLSRVLAALAAFGLTANLRRSRFFLPSIQLFNWTVRHGKVISNGLSFEPAAAVAGQRLTLLIELSPSAATCRAVLQRRSDGDEERTLLGCFSSERKDDETSRERLVEHLQSAIEHFRQFLLFVPFEIALNRLDVGDCGGETELRRRLLKVQQFDFKLICHEPSGLD